MFRHTIPIGRVLGIPIDLDYSWFLIAVLITWMLAVNYYPVEFKGETSVEYWLMGAVTAVLFFVSIVVHELAHFRRATLIAASTGRFFGFLFIVVGVWQALRGNVVNGLWIAFIGWFLESAAAAQVQQQMVQGLLVGHKVSEAMGTACTRVSGDTSLQKVVDQEVLTHGRQYFLVEQGDRVIGLLTLHDMKEIPRPSWTTTTAAQAMVPLEKLSRLDSNAELWTAMEKMSRDEINQMPVVLGNKLVGMLSTGDIVKYLQTLKQLGT